MGDDGLRPLPPYAPFMLGGARLFHGSQSGIDTAAACSTEVDR